MWAKLGAQLIVELLKFIPGLVAKGVDALRAYLERKKRIRTAEEAAKKVEDAKSPEDIRTAADDLP